ncbi:relaxosome protein TraM, partial [Pseudomonas aeruginosa]
YSPTIEPSGGNPKFEYANMVEDIREKVSSEMERFFPENDEG